MSSYNLVKTEGRVRENSRAASRVFTDLQSNSPKRSTRFLPGYEGKEKMFYFLNEIHLSLPQILNNFTFKKKISINYIYQ